MIKLVSEDVDIRVKEDNRLYAILRAFVGESFTVELQGDEKEIEYVYEEKQDTHTKVTIENNLVLTKLQHAFSEDFLKSSVGKILSSHFTNNLSENSVSHCNKLNSYIYQIENKDFYIVGNYG